MNDFLEPVEDHLRQGSPVDEGDEGRQEVEVGQVALKRPAVGHFLVAEAPGSTRACEAIGKTALASAKLEVYPEHDQFRRSIFLWGARKSRRAQNRQQKSEFQPHA